jgi:type I restriction enzyme S subunit
MIKNRHYPLTRFGDVAREVSEAERDPLENGLDRLIGLEHIEPENLHIKEWGSVADGTSFTRVFRKGHVLFGKRRAYQRKVALAEFDGICSSDIIVMEAIEDKLVPELLPFIVQSEGFFEHALSTSAGSLSPRTKWKHLAEYKFPLPPKDEQRRIAEILWAADYAVEIYANLLKAQTDFFDVYISNFISGQITKSENTKKTLYGNIPSHWEVRPVAEVAEVDYGISESVKDNKDPSLGWPIITGGNITIEGKFDLSDMSHIEPPTKESFILKKGDLLFNWRSGSREHVGKTARFELDGDYTYASFILRVRVKENLNNIYLHHLLNHMRRTGLLAHTTSQQVNFKMNATIFRNLPIIVPPLEEQQLVVKQLESLENITQMIIDHLESLKSLKANLMTSNLGI